MKRIELVSLDNVLTRKLGQELERRLRALSFSVRNVTNDDCLLAEAIQIVKSYSTIEVDRNTLVHLEYAKRCQIEAEILYPRRHTDDMFIFTESTLANLMLLQYNESTKKVILKKLIKKEIKKPDAIVYLEVDIEAFVKRRKSRTQKNRVIDSMKGLGMKSRNTKYKEILGKINSRYGTKASIINIEDKFDDISAIADSVLEFLTTNEVVSHKAYNEIS